MRRNSGTLKCFFGDSATLVYTRGRNTRLRFGKGYVPVLSLVFLRENREAEFLALKVVKTGGRAYRKRL